MLEFYASHLKTPVGKLTVVASDTAVTQIGFELPFDHLSENAVSQKAQAQLTEYLEGKRQQFDLPLKPKGTEFQQRVWQALLNVGFGETANYGQIAVAIGNRNASRAVGMANSKNPIAIVIPCHRIIGSNGSLIGYAGGLHRKSFLLELENPC